MERISKSQYFLIKLMEECSEVSHRAAKQLQFGEELGANKARLSAEIDDLEAIIAILRLREQACQPDSAAQARKKEKLEKYWRYHLNLTKP